MMSVLVDDWTTPVFTLTECVMTFWQCSFDLYLTLRWTLDFVDKALAKYTQCLAMVSDPYQNKDCFTAHTHSQKCSSQWSWRCRSSLRARLPASCTV